MSEPAIAVSGLTKAFRTYKKQPGFSGAVRGLFPEHRAKVMELRGELFKKRQELFGLIKAEAPAMAPVQAKVREISDLQGKLEEELVRFLLEFKKRLKPEQDAVFLNQMQTRWDKDLGGLCGPMDGRGRHGPGMGPGRGLGPPGALPGTAPWCMLPKGDLIPWLSARTAGRKPRERFVRNAAQSSPVMGRRGVAQFGHPLQQCGCIPRGHSQIGEKDVNRKGLQFVLGFLFISCCLRTVAPFG